MVSGDGASGTRGTLPGPMSSYEYRHIVTFEDTNVAGNVFYVNHFRWQGRCRELFLREHAPEVLREIGKSVCLLTRKCSCEFYAELAAFDEVVVRMTLGEVVQNRVTMSFEYYRCNGGEEELVAHGEQEVITMRRDGDDRLVPTPIPEALREALVPYVRG